jgi:hypothetical protein
MATLCINASGLNRIKSSCLTLRFLDLNLEIRAEMYTRKVGSTAARFEGRPPQGNPPSTASILIIRRMTTMARKVICSLISKFACGRLLDSKLEIEVESGLRFLGCWGG